MKKFSLLLNKRRAIYVLVFIALGLLFIPKDLTPVDFRVIDSKLEIPFDSPAMALVIDQFLPTVEEPISIEENINLKSGTEALKVMELNKEFKRFSEEELRQPTYQEEETANTTGANRVVLDSGIVVMRDQDKEKSFSEKLRGALKRQYAIYPAPKISGLSTLLATRSSKVSRSGGNSIIERSPLSSIKRPVIDESVVVNNTRRMPLGTTAVELTGQVVLREGLIYTGQEHLEVFHEVEGEKQIVAETSIDTGDFNIRVNTSQDGDLVAELRSSSGNLLGESRVPLLNLNPDQPLTLNITPLLSRISGRIVSAYSYDKHYIPVQPDKISVYPIDVDLDINEGGHFKEEDILLPGSQYLLSAEAKGYWNSLVMTDSRSESLVHMFPNGMIESLYGLVNERPEPESEGVIWGKVLARGKEIKGVKVDLAIDDVIGPIYFNGFYLPDRSLNETTENGLFAYLKVPPGMHALRTSHSGRNFLTDVVAVEPHSVTRSNVEIDLLKSGHVYVYDALTGQPVETDILYSGNDVTGFAEGGILNLRFNRSRKLLFLESQGSDEHYPSRVVVDRKDSLIRMPLARRDWIDSIKAQMKINYVPSSGYILGFLDEQQYDVLLNHSSPHSQLVYFDKEGQPLQDGDTNKKYGFLLFNVGHGLGGLTINTQSGVLSKIFHSDSGHLSVVTTGN